MIDLKAETLISINGLNITNTLLTSYLVILIISVFLFNLRYKLNPTKIQTILEVFYESVYNFWHGITHLNNQKIFTFCLTFLIYISVANLIILFPPFEAFYLNKNSHHIHLFRSVFSDMNMTLALALISVIITNILGLLKLGVKFIKKFLSPLGILELISEFAKIISFSFRLFGNIFGGKVLLMIISFLISLLVPSIFIGLEIFVGIIQSFIFFVLTSVFIKVALEH